MAIKSLTVFCGSRNGSDPLYCEHAKQVGWMLAEKNITLIYGGGNKGIMGAVANAVLEKGGRVIGIMPGILAVPEHRHVGLSEMIEVEDMHVRKRMLYEKCDAIAVFPGGFGTMDELFEILTLVQTGKANIIPIVLVEGQDGVYWRDWKKYIDGHLLSNGWISPEDLHLFYIAKSVDEAVAHVQKFYHCYHSSRYVGPKLVIRLKKELTDEQISQLNHDYKGLVSEGKIEKTPPLAGESDHLDLPRIAFCHTNRDFGILRNMIDTINEWELLKGSQKPQVEIL